MFCPCGWAFLGLGFGGSGCIIWFTVFYRLDWPSSLVGLQALLKVRFISYTLYVCLHSTTER